MADVIHGNTQLANWLPTNFAPMVEGFFRRSLSLGEACYDASAWSTGGKTVTYPSPGDLTAVVISNDQTPLTEHVGTASAEAAVTINMSTQYGVPLFFTLMAMKQVSQNVDLMTEYASRGSYALMKKFENTLALIIQTATTNDVTLSATTGLVTWAKLLEGWGALGADGVAPFETTLALSGGAWGVSVADWGVNYTSAANTGTNDNFLATGRWGYIGRTPVYVSPDWENDGTAGDEAASLWAKKAVSYAIQGGIDILGPTDSILGGGKEIGLYMNWGVALAIDAGVCNFNDA